MHLNLIQFLRPGFHSQGAFLSCFPLADSTFCVNKNRGDQSHGPLAVLRTCMFLSTSLVVTVCVPTFIDAVCQMALAKPVGSTVPLLPVSHSKRRPARLSAAASFSLSAIVFPDS